MDRVLERLSFDGCQTKAEGEGQDECGHHVHQRRYVHGKEWCQLFS